MSQIATPIINSTSGGAKTNAIVSSTKDFRIASSTTPSFMHSSMSLSVKMPSVRLRAKSVSHSCLVVGTKTSSPLQSERQDVQPTHRMVKAIHSSNSARGQATDIADN